MKVALIRHGKTLGNENKKFIGITDENLSEKGIEEIKSYIDKKIYPSFDYLFTSPMKRCLQTLELIYNTKNYKVISDLKEMNFGKFENLNFEEITKNSDYKNLLKQNNKFFFPDGESENKFKERCISAFESILKLNKNCVIICHGGTIMSIMEKYGTPEKNFYDWNTENGKGYILEISKDIFSYLPQSQTLFKVSSIEKITG